MTDYTPGVCNIDYAGQRKRMIFGAIGIALGSAVTILTIVVTLSTWWMALSFILFWMGTIGIVQARSKFCVANAAKARYEINGKMTPIEDHQSQLLDVKRARILHLQAITYAIILTGICTALILWLRS